MAKIEKPEVTENVVLSEDEATETKTQVSVKQDENFKDYKVEVLENVKGTESETRIKELTKRRADLVKSIETLSPNDTMYSKKPIMEEQIVQIDKEIEELNKPELGVSDIVLSKPTVENRIPFITGDKIIF